jgi:hypothetical protein
VQVLESLAAVAGLPAAPSDPETMLLASLRRAKQYKRRLGAGIDLFNEEPPRVSAINRALAMLQGTVGAGRGRTRRRGGP